MIKGIYENSIRRSSPIEKIFEVFATVKGDDNMLKMTIYDFMRAICPFSGSTKPIEELKVLECEKRHMLKTIRPKP